MPVRAKFARNRKISTTENDTNTHETDGGQLGGQQQSPGGGQYQAGSNLSWKKKNGGGNGNGNRRNDSGNKPKMGNWFR